MASVVGASDTAGNNQEEMPVADTQLLTLRFKSPALERAFLTHWSRVSVWLDSILAIVSLAACSSWAAAYTAVWQGLSPDIVGSWAAIWQGLWPSAQEQQTCATQDSETECAAVYDFSRWPQLLVMLMGLTVLCSTCSIVGCSLAVWPNGNLSQHRKVAAQLTWWLARMYSVVAAITHCSLQMPGVSCTAVSWFTAFLAVATPMYAPFYMSAVCSILYCIFWCICLYTVEAEHVSMRQHVTHLLIQAFIPVVLQFALKVGLRVRFAVRYRQSSAGWESQLLAAEGSPSRTSSLSDRMQQEEAMDYERGQMQQQTEWPGAMDFPGASQPSASAAAAVAAAAAAAASSGAGGEQVMTAGAPTVVVAALPAMGDGGNDRASRPQSGPSLIYESPLLHRTIGVKVYSTSGMSRQMVASRLAASVQAALDSLPQGVRIVDQTGHVSPLDITGMSNSSSAEDPAGSQAVLVNRVLVPGCVMLLGQVITQQYRSQQRRAPVQQPMQNMGTWPSGEGAWTVQLIGAQVTPHALSNPAGGSFHYPSIYDLEAAVTDGTCTRALQTWLDMCAADDPASQQSCSSLQHQSVISGWGRELQLLLADQLDAAGSTPTSHSQAVTDLLVRLVLAHGNDVVMDRQVAVPRILHTTGSDGSSFAWLLSQQLPHKSFTDRITVDLSAGACALSLHVLSTSPQYTPMSDASSNQNDNDSRQLANITILLLPQEAADEAIAWARSSSILQQHLQTLLQDMGVVLQACTMATTVGAAAAATAAVVSNIDGKTRNYAAASAADISAGAAAADTAVHAMKLPASYWRSSAAAALRVQLFLEAHGLERCSSIMGRCLQELQQVASKVGIPAADGQIAAGHHAAMNAFQRASARDAVSIGLSGDRCSIDRNNRLWSP